MKYLVQTTPKGLEFTSDYTRKLFQDDARKREYPRAKIEFITPESSKMRGYLHGAIIPLIVWFQEGMDYRRGKDCELVYEWLKQEFGEYVRVGDKVKKVGYTSKGRLKELMEQIIDWGTANGYPMELCDPEGYKRWRDELSFDGPETYIDYLVLTGRLTKK